MTNPSIHAPTTHAPATEDRDLLDTSLRRVIATAGAAFLPYDRYGVAREDMEYLPLGDARDGSGPGVAGVAEIFLIRFKPGAASTPHEHTGGEAFYVLEGELKDCDGAVFGAGDYVRYQPGSRHFSVSETGCTLLVMLGGRNRPVGEG